MWSHDERRGDARSNSQVDTSETHSSITSDLVEGVERLAVDPPAENKEDKSERILGQG